MPEGPNPRKKVHKLLSVPLKSVINLSLAPFAYYRNYKTEEMKKALEITSENGVELLEPVTLGDLNQWILVRGENAENPVLLFLHGGPGLPLMPFHTINSELEKHYLVVHWDQRGSGKSYSNQIPRESMTIDQLVSDTHELIQYLRQRFNKQKIYLAGFSCGSVLGMKIAQKYPELLEAYIGIGQIVRMEESEAISYQFAVDHAAKSQNAIAQKELALIGPPPYTSHRSMLEERMWLNSFGGFFYHGHATLKFYKTGFMSPDYSLTDIRQLFKGMDFTSEMLWTAFYQTDLFQEIPKLEVPVFFVEGRHDYVVPSSVTARYFEQLQAPRGKTLIWFEESAHWPFLEEPEQFHDVMVDILHRTQARSQPSEVIQ